MLALGLACWRSSTPRPASPRPSARATAPSTSPRACSTARRSSSGATGRHRRSRTWSARGRRRLRRHGRRDSGAGTAAASRLRPTSTPATPMAPTAARPGRSTSATTSTVDRLERHAAEQRRSIGDANATTRSGSARRPPSAAGPACVAGLVQVRTTAGVRRRSTASWPATQDDLGAASTRSRTACARHGAHRRPARHLPAGRRRTPTYPVPASGRDRAALRPARRRRRGHDLRAWRDRRAQRVPLVNTLVTGGKSSSSRRPRPRAPTRSGRCARRPRPHRHLHRDHRAARATRRRGAGLRRRRREPEHGRLHREGRHRRPVLRPSTSPRHDLQGARHRQRPGHPARQHAITPSAYDRREPFTGVVYALNLQTPDHAAAV